MREANSFTDGIGEGKPGLSVLEAAIGTARPLDADRGKQSLEAVLSRSRFVSDACREEPVTGGCDEADDAEDVEDYTAAAAAAAVAVAAEAAAAAAAAAAAVADDIPETPFDLVWFVDVARIVSIKSPVIP